MPIYEYRCSDCNRKFSKLSGMVAQSSQPVCPNCGSSHVSRLISKFRSAKSHEDVMTDMEEKFSGVNMDDPKSVTQAMKEMGSALRDEEDFGDNYDVMMDRAEKEVYDGAQNK
ncbi:MAG: zinc ribbon domain-containing protein [Armatimonadetes bacterium]|nr:zinc ribbon domain-containing protein [Candidatus Hippobium faecium]